MRILVTGGAGFIGSHVVDACVVRGHDVVVLDDFSTGAAANLRPHRRLTVHRGGLLADAELTRRLVADADLVFHLAALVGVDLVSAQPERTLAVNGDGAQVVIEAAARARTRVVLASSSEVYGCGHGAPFREDHDVDAALPAGRRGAYARSKRHAESCALEAARSAGLDVLVVRLFNVVGPRQRARFGMVLPRFVAAAVEGAPLRVFGDGRQVRAFADVRDVVATLWRLVSRGAWGGIVNLGSPAPCSIGDLARRVLRVSRSESSIEFVPYATARPVYARDVPSRVPCLERLTERAGGAPPFRGLDATIRELVVSAARCRRLVRG